MDILSLLVSLLSGAVGGNVAGAVMQERSLGTLGNSLVGILGGGLGATVLQALGIAASASGGLDLAGIVGSIASGGTGGAILLLIISLVRGTAAKA